MTILRLEDPQRPIYARSGWKIPYILLPPQDPQLVQIRAKELAGLHRKSTVRSASSHSYNCVGMIFASRRVWIEIDHIGDLLRADGYRRISDVEIMEGDVVLYKRNQTPTHVGVIMFIDRGLTNIKVMSKWGKDPEFLHFIDDVPERFGEPTEYYTERQPHESS